MLRSSKRLRSIENNRLHGNIDYTIEDLDKFVDAAIENVVNKK